ncbi:nucleoid-associated protein [Bacillus sp. UNCCL81]|uniref:nucleoid-associated protein n=1 Tax=Bacillus sp. UNCCL81 TaxID=1502755 RepID=UPI0008E84137|nr:nucleoid-associated protein [Bacillus sp. UNCCL81]SFC42263.1 hypothetical protein SAMN02799633_00755 [Bacillus sp. UNCCL81]
MEETINAVIENENIETSTVVETTGNITNEFFVQSFEMIHHIKTDENIIVEKGTNTDSIKDYVKKVTQEILKKQDKRYFKFQSNTSQVKTQIDSIINIDNTISSNLELSKNSATTIAKRLLEKERITQQRYSQITEIKVGSLIQTQINYKGNLMYLITKVEFENYIEADNFNPQVGLPYENKALKACLITFDEDKNVDEIFVTDSNNKISSYWVKDFLEIEECNSNESNTKKSFEAIDHFINKNIKPVSPQDYQIFRNNLVGYYRTQENFSFENMINNVFGVNPPLEENLNMENIKTKLKELTTKNHFDTSFIIVPKEITAKIRKIIKISPKIELKLIDHVENMTDSIFSTKNDNQEMLICIKTTDEKVFNQFKFQNN